MSSVVQVCLTDWLSLNQTWVSSVPRKSSVTKRCMVTAWMSGARMWETGWEQSSSSCRAAPDTAASTNCSTVTNIHTLPLCCLLGSALGDKSVCFLGCPDLAAGAVYDEVPGGGRGGGVGPGHAGAVAVVQVGEHGQGGVARLERLHRDELAGREEEAGRERGDRAGPSLGLPVLQDSPVEAAVQGRYLGRVVHAEVGEHPCSGAARHRHLRPAVQAGAQAGAGVPCQQVNTANLPTYQPTHQPTTSCQASAALLPMRVKCLHTGLRLARLRGFPVSPPSLCPAQAAPPGPHRHTSLMVK